MLHFESEIFPTLFLISLVLGLPLLSIFWNYWKTKRGPPGPVGLPVLGYFPSSFGSFPYRFLDKLVESYGDVMSIRVLGRYYVVLSSYDAIRQAYIVEGDKFLNRPLDFSVMGSIFDFKALAFINGEEWKRQRKTLVSIIRQLDREGTGFPSLEIRINQSINWLIEELEKNVKTNEPIDIYQPLARVIVRLNSSLISSHSLEDDPKAIDQIIDDMHLAFTLSPGGDAWLAGNLLHLVNNTFTEKAKTVKKLRERAFSLMEHHFKNRSETPIGEVPSDYVGALLLNNEPTETKAILANMFMFYVAATDTSSSAIYTGIYCLAKQQHIQEKFQKELDEILGPNAHIQKVDQKKLPYVDAVIKEILRYGVIGPIPQPRQTSAPLKLNGYYIPAKTHIIANLWTSTRDPKYFTNPQEFDPMNFYGRNLPRDIYMLPFSLGKRACPGMSLGESNIFLFLTNLFQKYTISLAPEFQDIPERMTPGFTRVLSPYKIELKPRSP